MNWTWSFAQGKNHSGSTWETILAFVKYAQKRQQMAVPNYKDKKDVIFQDY